MILIILLSILVVLLVIVLFIAQYKKNFAEMKMFIFNGKFNNYDHSDPPLQPFNELGLKEVATFDEANLFLFTDYTFIDDYIADIKFKKDAIIYGFKGVDQLANKGYLANYMRGSKYLPKTYILSENEYPTEDNTLYILKKNIQRQEGLLITKDLKYIKEQALEDYYVVAQELLQDVYLVNKRKINMRVYMLVVIDKLNIDWYIYKDGFIYYAPKEFEENSADKEVNVTTGYIDREIYENNPLTHKDLYKFIGEEKADILKKNINALFRTIKDKYSKVLINENKDIPGLKFKVFGADVGPTSILDVTCQEINKGCNLTYMDERDKEVKFNMIKNMMTLVGVMSDGDPSMFKNI